MPAPPPTRTRWLIFMLIVALTTAVICLLAWPLTTGTDAEPHNGGFRAAMGTPSPSFPADAQVSIYGECLTRPREFQDVMALLRAQLYDPSAVIPPSRASAVLDARGDAVRAYTLPDGLVPTGEHITEVTVLFGQYLNCPTLLESIGYWTDDNLIRSGLSGDGSGYLVSGLWEGANPEPGEPVPSGPDAITDGNDSTIRTPLPPRTWEVPDQTGDFSPYQLYGMRMIDSTHLGAYLRINALIGQPDGEAIETRFDQTNFVVFELQLDGGWLIDEFVTSFDLPGTRYVPEDSATPVA